MRKIALFAIFPALLGSVLVLGEDALTPCVRGDKEPQQIELSPFEQGNLISSQRPRQKNLWADSWLFLEVPRLDEKGKIIEETDESVEIPAVERIHQFLKIEEWYNAAPPDLEGKYVLIEFWATWCPPCRRSLPMLNGWHEKFGDELVVISICETNRAAIDDMPGDLKGKDLAHFVGIDTQRRCANALNVWGIPHAILVEPMYGGIVWEGMPNQPNYELSDEIIEKILSVGRKLKNQK
ncbi:MAG: TlpA disulfide reductase family protein [Planctomycetia bacterium]|nr:TlpA disulfide reductase family protein [Planctomycetia bacterium]